MLSSSSTVLIPSHLIAPTCACNPVHSLKMDAIIDYNEVAGFWKNPPLAGAMPRFCQHLHLPKTHDQSTLTAILPTERHPWLVRPCNQPATYLLLEGTTFVNPWDPSATAVYPQWAAPTTVKMIDATFLHDKNYFVSYNNIARACFCMFDVNIAAQFKVSNTPSITGGI
jgi:hypothetical protein